MSGLILNEDDSHFYSIYPLEKINREGVNELVDHYVSPQIKELVFNVNAQRTNFSSQVWQTAWDGFDPNGGLDQPWLKSVSEEYREQLWKIFQKLSSLDLPQLWIDRVRFLGKSPWLSVRMNDVHDVGNLDDICHSDFWRNHSEYWRVPDPNRFNSWMARAFDYRHEAVRNYYMSLIQELFERYDFDGLELDWMRFYLHFKPGFEEEGRHLLIDFHRQVRELADKYAKRRGHYISIGVRVPSRPETARNLGLDAVAWAKEKLIDLIVITPFWATIEFDMPIELWRELLGDCRILLAAGLEINLRPSPKVWPKYGQNFANTAETVLGASSSFLARGVDRIYLFNYMDKGPAGVDSPEDHQKIIHNAGELATATANSRRHIVTFSDVQASGEPAALSLPAECAKNRPASFRIHIGPSPRHGTAQVIIGLGEDGNMDTAGLDVHVNETLCSASDRPMPTPIHPVVRKTRSFEVPLEVLHDGYNYVEISTSSEQQYQIFWAEIIIRSL